MLETLKHDLFYNPSKSLLLAAKYTLAMLGRGECPDWVEALANGNPDLWESVIDVARDDCKFEEAAHE